jgi:putative transposase
VGWWPRISRRYSWRSGSSTAASLARGFVERYRDWFKRAVEVFAQGLEEALTYLDFPSGHQRHIKSTNVLERRWWGYSRTKRAWAA